MKLKSDENGVLFFKVKKAGLTVAYKIVGSEIHFAPTWKKETDRDNSILAREIAASRLQSGKKGKYSCPRDTEGRERNSVLKVIDKMISVGFWDGFRNDHCNVRQRWEAVQGCQNIEGHNEPD
jgi:hypothetical protein